MEEDPGDYDTTIEEVVFPSQYPNLRFWEKVGFPAELLQPEGSWIGRIEVHPTHLLFYSQNNFDDQEPPSREFQAKVPKLD